MRYLDGSEKTLLGINIGVLGFGIAFILVFLTLFIDSIMQVNNKWIDKLLCYKLLICSSR